jgi:hypothetical protein
VNVLHEAGVDAGFPVAAPLPCFHQEAAGILVYNGIDDDDIGYRGSRKFHQNVVSLTTVRR